MEINEMDDEHPVTVSDCELKRGTCRDNRKNGRWVVGVLFALFAGVFGIYVVPAVSAGYAAMHRLDTHEARQEETFKTLESKFATLRDYHGDLRKTLLIISDEQRDQRDLIIRSLDAKASTP